MASKANRRYRKAASDIDPADLVPLEWYDEIPVRPSVFKARLASLATALLAGLGVGAWFVGNLVFQNFLFNNAAAGTAIQEAGLLGLLFMVWPAFGGLGVISLIVGLASLKRSRATYRLLRASLLAIYPIVLGYSMLVWSAISIVCDQGIPIDGGLYEKSHAVMAWWKASWPALAVGVYAFWLHLILASRSVVAAFTGEEGEAMQGDYVLEDWRTHGRDPRARCSLYTSFWAHILVIIIIPFLLSLRGCVDPFSVPKGSGVEAVAVVTPKVVKKKKKKKKLVLAKSSSIIWHEPDLFEETEADKVMEQQTELEYTATGVPGKIGTGDGKDGGWPEGMEDAIVRFPRLNHGGMAWDDGMNHTDADVNFLREFKKVTGFKVASKGEALTTGQLKALPDDGFPPFLFITGNGPVGNLSTKDCEILRDYCFKGGMLIGDAGSATFDQSFRHLLKRIFPGKRLVDISDNDVLYQQPTSFPDGAPSFWHHGGDRGLGVKHEGRWIVFYHPGDMNDAWKSQGYSDVTPEMRHNAMQLGINLVAYSFNQWNDAVARLRK
jgi:hypothetical protein